MSVATHPTLLEQQALRGNPPMDAGEDGFIRESFDAFDIDSTPRTVAALALSALVVLAMFKVAGFRFSFGVGAGGG